MGPIRTPWQAFQPSLRGGRGCVFLAPGSRGATPGVRATVALCSVADVEARCSTLQSVRGRAPWATVASVPQGPHGFAWPVAGRQAHSLSWRTGMSAWLLGACPTLQRATVALRAAARHPNYQSIVPPRDGFNTTRHWRRDLSGAPNGAAWFCGEFGSLASWASRAVWQ